MRKTYSKPLPMRARWSERLRAAAFACLATLLALPANAGISVPNDPLTTGSRVPPNILFILDDSGSMASDYMPDAVPATTTPDVSRLAYTRNTLSYNPAFTYQPWTNADSTLMTGGTSYRNVYTDANFLNGSLDLATATRTFYLPKPGITDEADGKQYYRYTIVGGNKMYRAEYGKGSTTGVQTPAGYPQTGLGATSGGMKTLTPTVTLPDDVSNFTVTLSGGTYTLLTGGADLYVRRGNAPTGGNFDCRSTNIGNADTCSITNPDAGTWYIGLSRGGNYANVKVTVSYTVQNNRCDGGTTADTWINCVETTPTGRTLANELTNYATWYSYHRTREKVAKAGSGQAFAGLGKDVRVGFRTIWRREVDGNPMTQAYPILVNSNEGLFDDPNGAGGANNNRTIWYERLYAAYGDGTTPLHGALTDAGRYYSNSNKNGPYGPQDGDAQLQCRQNFTILTSDGYWNGKSNYTDLANEQDNNNGDVITGPGGKTYRYTPARPYSSADSDTLADVAMRYWKSDLRTDLDNIVPTTAADPAFWQHMTTFAISIGERGTLDPTTDLPKITSGALSWPTPVNNTIVNIDDMWHASVNGHGDFLVASNPDEFTRGLKNALASITERVGSYSNVAANSTRIDTDTQVFQATYISGVWTGELNAYKITTAGVATEPTWRASEHIPASGRNIFTYDGRDGVAFPTAGQVAALSRNRTTDEYKVTGENNAAYIKGARDLELASGGMLRNRNSLMGDIVSSSPAYVADTDTLYVGANDGMLHAINARTGAEQFTYVPAGLNFADLASISRPDYAHRYFVDGPIAVSNRDQTEDKNILVGSLGRGGKGVFALDVTTPGSFDGNDVEWDKTGSAADTNMGWVQGAPVIAKLNNGVTAVLVANGINSGNDHAVLFIYNLKTGAKLAELDTGAGSTISPNGMTSVVGWDADGDGDVDTAYAGDLAGNLWKFDLSSSTSSDWSNTTNRSKLFAASYPATPTNIAQPISGGITVTLDPITYETWVLFGTGRFLTLDDVGDKSVQSLYGIIDKGASTILRTELKERKLVLIGEKDGAARTFEENGALPTGKKGWFIDLVTPPSSKAEGERIVSDPQMYGNALVVASIIPVSTACESSGKGFVNALDAFSGTSLTSSLFDINGDGNTTDETLSGGGKTIPIGSIDLGVGMGTMPNLMRGRLTQGGSSGGQGSKKIKDPRNTGRVSWREVIKD